jgi:type IV secretion system protein VirD4
VSNDRPVLGRRTWRGIAYGPVVRLESRSSLLVVGPTQTGKTSSLVIPALLSWSGAAVVTSVKNDVMEATSRWRAAIGDVQVLEPGREEGLTWNPLEGIGTLRHALRVARDLTSGSSTRGDTEFWNALASKMVAALLMLAVQNSGDIFDVAMIVENRRFERWAHEGATSEASELMRSFLDHDAKTLDGVVTTAETMLLPWRFRQPLARIRPVVAGAHTLYLCSPRNEQQQYEPLFRGALRMILEEQQSRVEQKTQVPLLMVLDEAATVASLDELDQMAATVSGLDVTLVTIVQDFAQLSARWGARAQTIVNNHATRLVMSGLADPTVSKYLPELITMKEGVEISPIRQRSTGTAVVVAGRRPVFVVRLRPWWRERRFRHRGSR